MFLLYLFFLRSRPHLAPLGEAVVYYFAYIVNYAIEQPLDVYFNLASQGKAIQALVCPDVGKDRFGYGNAPRIDLSPLLSINLASHSP